MKYSEKHCKTNRGIQGAYLIWVGLGRVWATKLINLGMGIKKHFTRKILKVLKIVKCRGFRP